MSRPRGTRIWIALAFWGSAAALAQAQQQYGDPTNFPGTYLTQRTSPPTPVGLVPRIDVTYFVDGTFTATEHALIVQAAGVWSGTTASVRLVEVFAIAGANIDLTSVNLNNNTTNLADRVITSVPGPLTYPDGTTPWRQITSASITIDRNLPAITPFYYLNPTPILPNEYDYFSVVLRELGLGLGLGFAPGEPGSVMDPNITTGETHRTLSPNDIAALQTLYGTPEPETWALFGIGLIALGLLRRFGPAV